MKNSVARMLGLAALAISMVGCKTMQYNDLDDPNTGKVWRVQVRDDIHFTGDAQAMAKEFDSGSTMRKFVSDVHLTPERLSRVRAAPFVLRLPGIMGWITFGEALVPDNIPSEDIRKGAIVDVMRERILDYNKNQFNRVIRVVCRAEDDACADRIKKDGPLFSVVDANPTPGDLHGLTYDHKVTKEEEQRYFDFLKSH